MSARWDVKVIQLGSNNDHKFPGGMSQEKVSNLCEKVLCKVFHAGLPAHFVLIAEIKNISVSCLPSGSLPPDDSSSQGHLLCL